MVTLYSAHPSRIPDEVCRQLHKLSYGVNRGYMAPYLVRSDEWHFMDKVYWLERDHIPFAWAIRTQDYPYCTPYFMVYIKAKERRKHWGTFLYQEATRWSKQTYEVMGSHARSAEKFYEQLGRLDYD